MILFTIFGGERFGGLSERRSVTSYLFLTPLMAFLLASFVSPLVYILFISFHRYDYINIVGDALTLQNYVEFVADPFYRSFIMYTIRLSVINTVACIGLGYPVGHYLANTNRIRRGIVLSLILLPLMVGSVVRAYGWILLLGEEGIIAQLGQQMFGESIVLLGTTGAVYIGLFNIMLPFSIIPIYSSLVTIDDSLVLSARDLGANKFQAFYQITLPLSLPGVVSGSIFVFTLTMSSVVTPKLLGGRTDFTVGAMIYDMVFTNTNWPFASAMAMVVSFITFALVYGHLTLFGDETR